MTDNEPPDDGPPRFTVIETLSDPSTRPASQGSASQADIDPEENDNAPLSERNLARGAANDEAILVRISILEEDHNDLSQAIEALEALPHHDRLSVARLKKKKLQIKDKIQALKNSLTPDIIA